MFISFEGIDGSGKSSQSKALLQGIKNVSLPAILTREPGGSAGAETIRKLLVSGDKDAWSPETEILLFNAARRDHLERTIRPALERGEIVITDRFADSTRVYQGAVRAELRDIVDAIHKIIIKQEPDLTFVIDLDPETARDRMSVRDDAEARFESFGLEFQHALRHGFLALAEEFPQRIVVIDGHQSEDEIAAEIFSTFMSHYSSHQKARR